MSEFLTGHTGLSLDTGQHPGVQVVVQPHSTLLFFVCLFCFVLFISLFFAFPPSNKKGGGICQQKLSFLPGFSS